MERLQQSLDTLIQQVGTANKPQPLVTSNPPEKETNTDPTPIESSQLELKPKSYAEVTSPRSRKAWKRVTASLVKERTEPLQFKKIHIRITDSRPLKRCKSAKEVNELLRQLLKHIGIEHLCPLYSKIGNSILEVYVPANSLRDVIGTLEMKKVEILFESKAAKRLAFLYKRARLVNLKKCVLEGFDEAFVQKILNYVTEDRSITTHSESTVLIRPVEEGIEDTEMRL
jgi:hypothetical protein